MKKNLLIAMSLLAMMSCSDKNNEQLAELTHQPTQIERLKIIVKEPIISGANTRSIGSLEGRSVFEAINYNREHGRDLSGSDDPRDNDEKDEGRLAILTRRPTGTTPSWMGLNGHRGDDDSVSVWTRPRYPIEDMASTGQLGDPFRKSEPSQRIPTPELHETEVGLNGMRAVYPVVNPQPIRHDYHGTDFDLGRFDLDGDTIRFIAGGDADLLWGGLEGLSERIQQRREEQLLERAENRRLEMLHKLMRICFVVKRTSEFAPRTINKIELINVPTKVQLAISTGETTWDTADLDTIVAFDGNFELTSEPRVLASHCNIHPQDSVILNIQADGKLYTDHIVPFPKIGFQNDAALYNHEALSQGRLREGTSQVIELTFNPHEVESASKIAPWNDGGTVEITVQ